MKFNKSGNKKSEDDFPVIQISSASTIKESELNTSNIELRSEEIQELMGRVPSIIIRRGLTVILVCILFLFCLSYIVEYQEYIYIGSESKQCQ